MFEKPTINYFVLTGRKSYSVARSCSITPGRSSSQNPRIDNHRIANLEPNAVVGVAAKPKGLSSSRVKITVIVDQDVIRSTAGKTTSGESNLAKGCCSAVICIRGYRRRVIHRAIAGATGVVVVDLGFDAITDRCSRRFRHPNCEENYGDYGENRRELLQPSCVILEASYLHCPSDGLNLRLFADNL